MPMLNVPEAQNMLLLEVKSHLYNVFLDDSKRLAWQTVISSSSPVIFLRQILKGLVLMPLIGENGW